MSLQQMVHLGRSPVTRLIVGPGEVGKGRGKGLSSVGFLITSQLLANCKAPPSDIYDPSTGIGRSGYRDEHGFDKKQGEVFASGGGGGTRKMVKVEGARKGKAAWAYNAFKDYGGLYCDRIACGSPAERVAVLQPHSGLERTGQSMAMVLNANRNLDGCDVLLIYPTRRLPFGGAVLTTLRGTEQRGLIDPLTQDILISANDAVVYASGFEMDDDASPSRKGSNTSTSSSSRGSGANMLDQLREEAGMMDNDEEAQCDELPFPPNEVDAEAGLTMSVLSVGIDVGIGRSDSIFSAHDHSMVEGGPHTPMSPKALAVARHYLCPKLAFACAYWCSTPAKAAKFLDRDVEFVGGNSGGDSHQYDDGRRPYPRLCQHTLAKLRAATTRSTRVALRAHGSLSDKRGNSTANPIASLVGVGASTSVGEAALADIMADPAEAKLFASMQKPLLSSTNQSIMTAYALGMAVTEDGSMNETNTMAAAEKIMRDVQGDGYWAVSA